MNWIIITLWLGNVLNNHNTPLNSHITLDNTPRRWIAYDNTIVRFFTLFNTPQDYVICLRFGIRVILVEFHVKYLKFRWAHIILIGFMAAAIVVRRRNDPLLFKNLRGGIIKEDRIGLKPAVVYNSKFGGFCSKLYRN